MRHANERALAVGFGGQQSPIHERLELVDDGARESVEDSPPFRFPALLIDSYQVQQLGNHLLTCHSGLFARLFQRGIGLTLKRTLHTADIDVSLV